MKGLLLLDRVEGISKEVAEWFSSISPFSKNEVYCILPERRSRDAFLKVGEDFWQDIEKRDGEILLISMGNSSRVFHPDFVASSWMFYHIEKSNRVFRLISLPTSYSFFSKEGTSLFSALQTKSFISSVLEKEKDFKKILVLEDSGIKIFNLGVFPNLKINFLKDKKDLERLWDIKGKVALDLETSSLYFYSGSIISVSVYDGKEAYVFLFLDEFKEMLKEWLEKNVEVLVGANIKFDVLFLSWFLNNLDVLVRKEWLDPLLMILCLDNSIVRDRSLKSLVARIFHSIDYGTYFLGKGGSKEKEKWLEIYSSFLVSKDLENEKLRKVLEYSAMDVYWVWELEEYLMKRFDEDLLLLYKKVLEEPGKLLAEMSFRGLRIDWEELRKRNSLSEKALLELKNKIKEKTGITNPDSTKQIAEFFSENFKGKNLPKTKLGNPKVSYDVLSNLRDDERIDLLLNYKLLRHLNSNFLDEESFKRYSSGERIHPNFNQGTTMTGRLSSSDPNLQQLPGEKTNIKSQTLLEVYKNIWNVREFIIPEKGNKIMEVDLSQAELRGGAFLVQVRRMLYGFRRGEDLYRLLGKEVYKKPPSNITKAERLSLKTLLLGLMYGMSEVGVSRIFSVDKKRAREILEIAFTLFPELRNLSERIENILRERSINDVLLVGPTRQRLILEKCGWKCNKNFFNRMVYRRCFTSAINFPVQSMTSDWVLRLAIRLNKDFGDKVKILNLVHDSILFEVPEEEVDNIVKVFSEDYKYFLLDDPILPVIIKRILKNFYFGFPIIEIPPIKYEAKVGDSWGRASEIELPYKIEELPEWEEGYKLLVPIRKSEKDRKLLNFILVYETGVLLAEEIYKKLPEKAIVFVEADNKIKFKEWKGN